VLQELVMKGKEMDLDSDQPQRQLVMDTPSNLLLPQTIEYSLLQFYVRECYYNNYYNQISRLLQTHKLISITGNKGMRLVWKF
jgi:hypothetical protein